MGIEPEVETSGRAVVVAAVAEDLDRFEAATESIATQGEEFTSKVLALYLGVARATLMSIHQGGVPSQRQNREFAAKVFAAESAWSTVTQDDIYALLEGLCSDIEAPKLAPAQLFVTLFITTSYMLSWYSEPLGYQSFYDFLDAILHRLERPEG